MMLMHVWNDVSVTRNEIEKKTRRQCFSRTAEKLSRVVLVVDLELIECVECRVAGARDDRIHGWRGR